MPQLLFLTLAAAFAASCVLVPIVRAIAIRVGLVDKPDAERKLHERPIALAGGVAVFAAMLLAFGGVYVLGGSNQPIDWSSKLTGRWAGLFLAAGAMLIVGLVDDAWTLRGRQKLLLQSLIAMSLVGSGTLIEQVSLFGWELPLGAFAIPISVLWLLVATNALNLLDGADGMATTVGCFVCGGFAILAYVQGGSMLGVAIALALCGSLAGFLVYNRPPASIFLGDAGSMMVGLMVGVLAMWCSVKGSTVIAAVPIAILVLPLFDSSAAIIRRWMTGRSMYTTDRGHLHHLLHEKFGPAGMLLVVAILCTLSIAVAVTAILLDFEGLAPIGGLAVLIALIGTRSFGHSECRMLLGRTVHLVQSFFVRAQRCESTVQQRRIQFQGSGGWDVVWEPLVEFAKKFELAKVKIDVNMAWLHEGYHATWQSVRLPEKAFQSVVRIPLYAHRDGELKPVPIGRVEIIAANQGHSHEQLAEFLVHASELQTQVEQLVDQLDQQQRTKWAAKRLAKASQPVETFVQPAAVSPDTTTSRQPAAVGATREPLAK